MDIRDTTELLTTLNEWARDYETRIHPLHPDDGDGSNESYRVYDDAVNAATEDLRDIVLSYFPETS